MNTSITQLQSNSDIIISFSRQQSPKVFICKADIESDQIWSNLSKNALVKQKTIVVVDLK